MRVFMLLVALIIAGMAMESAGSTTYLVLPDGSGDFPTIQAAIDAAVTGDVIALGAGTFTGAGNRDIAIVGKAITVRSQGGAPADCVIDCQAAGRGFYLGASPGRTQFEGLTLQGGAADLGAGVLDESPQGADFVACVFQDNAASVAGGGVATYESPTFIRCAFIGNSAGEAGGGAGCSSGGQVNSPVFDECRFIGNTAASCGGALLLENVAPRREANVVRCTFFANSSAGTGAAVAALAQQPLIESCTFAGNTALSGGVLDYQWGTGTATLARCIIALSPSGQAVSCQGGSTVTLACCDVFGNEGGDWVGCIAGQEGQNGNLALDPCFCDPESGDLRLREDSPCAPDYNPACNLIGALPVGCSTPVRATTWGAIKALYR